MKFLSATNQTVRVNNACWNVRAGSQFATFEIGDSFQLIVAMYHDDKGCTYGINMRSDNAPVESEDLAEDAYDVDVELLGTKADKLHIHETFGLRLQFRPEQRLGRRGLGVANVRVVTSARQAKTLRSLSELTPKAVDAPAAPAKPSSIEDSPH